MKKPTKTQPKPSKAPAEKPSKAPTGNTKEQTVEESRIAMRAKMKLVSILQTEGGEKLSFEAVCKKGGYPEDGNDEDNTFAKFSPSADLTVMVTNPDLYGQLKAGQKFYLDFSLAD